MTSRSVVWIERDRGVLRRAALWLALTVVARTVVSTGATPLAWGPATVVDRATGDQVEAVVEVNDRGFLRLKGKQQERCLEEVRVCQRDSRSAAALRACVEG